MARLPVYSSGPITQRYASDKCRCCSAPILTANHIDAKPRWLFHQLFTDKDGRQRITLLQGCSTCADMDICLREAETENRRFTAISAYSWQCEHGSRCACGAVSVGIYSYCIRCSVERRMLDKAAAETKAIFNLLKDLRRQVKETLKESATNGY